MAIALGLWIVSLRSIHLTTRKLTGFMYKISHFQVIRCVYNISYNIINAINKIVKCIPVSEKCILPIF